MKDKLIVALDVDSLKEAKKLVDLLYPKVKMFKIGSQLFTLYGPQIVKLVQEKRANVFLDLKFHDIPNTAANSSIAAVRLKVAMFTLHAQGGLEMMKRAKEATDKEASNLGIKPPLIIGVTVLTSQSRDSTIEHLVISLTDRVRQAGLDGVVAAKDEIASIRDKFGKDLVVVTPGIRLTRASDDQKRTATPSEAVRLGANYIVVGRPILESPNPKKITEQILDSLT